ncbi:hypothetical protein DFH07DRAFT_870956 [Mycena maculata]|uniref:Protein-S-isoprenylcysteine O-methyltransferase n=1 Tax=Mycena maculata TaxID=230809 RepID=A0AAD7I2X7_9AGAR|nr:hypothetical protein DFH07DRAFT_870956 [Mycena maculata]
MVGFQIAVTPPNPPPPLGEQLATTRFEVVLRQRSGPVLVKCLCWAIALLEATVIVASHLPDWPCCQKIISVLVVNGNLDRLYVSPLFVFGIFLTLIGAFIRYWCYRELGSLFTFEVSIRENHKLVQTGPYHAVRHPGYTGVLLTVVGFFCWNASPGSWLRECGALETTMGLSVVGVFGLLVAAIAAGLLLRMSKEDEALEKHFGEEWEDWSFRVPYKLVPGVF